jgi:hypothetical protein
MSADAAPDLLDLAKTLRNEKFKSRALRGYVRLARQMGIAADRKVAMLEEAFQAAGRDEERKLVLKTLGVIPSAKSLSAVAGHLAAPALREDAAAAAIAIAEKIVQTEPAAVADAMGKVLQTGIRGEKANRAKALLKQGKRKE